MRAKIDVAIQPFSIPNLVRRDKKYNPHGDESDPAFPLASIDADTLGALCDQFREGVFRQAGKIDPRLK